MADINFGASVTIAEYTDVTGVANYRLLGAIPGCFRFRDAPHLNGDTVTYHVTDGPNVELVTGIFSTGTPDTLSRPTILASSNAGSPVVWSGRTRPILHEVAGASPGTATCVPAAIIDVYTGTSI